MNDSERTIHHYLTTLRLGEVRYEPDGNVPPDFLIDGRIAVEARRLNQNEEISGSFRGLEVTSTPLHSLVTKVLADSGPAAGGHSWFVMYTVWRPLPPWRELEALLRAAVLEFSQRLNDPPLDMRPHQSLRLRFFAASEPHDTLLVLGGSSDHDSGGFVVAELVRNLELCIPEKTRKIEVVRHKYTEWWLAFEDRIAYGALDANDAAQLRSMLRVSHGFHKILLVNPLVPQQAIEI